MKQKRFVLESPVRSFAAGAVLMVAAVGFFAGSVNAQSGSGQAATMQSAWALYTKNQFKESAESFEEVLKTSKPNARLYYYAAMANFRSNKRARARQLCQYIVQHFSGTTEAVHSAKMFPELASAAKTSTAEGASSGGTSNTGGTSSTAGTSTASATSASAATGSQELNESNLPAEFWAAIPKDMKKKIKDPSVQMALRGSFKDYQKKMGVTTEGGSKKGDKKTTVASASAKDYPAAAKFKIDSSMRRGEYPFSAEDIARDGANAIDQNINPNCWFEASMAALAELPRGQRLLSTMIRHGGPDTYIVRFPGDGVEYKITEEQMKKLGINDRALWASLIECAQVMKFPNNRGAEGSSGEESRLAVGLGCITGCKAQVMTPGEVGLQELSSFIAGAVSSKNPIVCGTWPDEYIPSPRLVVGQHAYTIIGFDAARKLVTVRNPHGKNSRRFNLKSDTRHEKFQMMDNGIFKIHLSIFQKSFSQVCRSFI